MLTLTTPAKRPSAWFTRRVSQMKAPLSRRDRRGALMNRRPLSRAT
jgi:hypothetical protein